MSVQRASATTNTLYSTQSHRSGAGKGTNGSTRRSARGRGRRASRSGVQRSNDPVSRPPHPWPVHATRIGAGVNQMAVRALRGHARAGCCSPADRALAVESHWARHHLRRSVPLRLAVFCACVRLFFSRKARTMLRLFRNYRAEMSILQPQTLCAAICAKKKKEEKEPPVDF